MGSQCFSTNSFPLWLYSRTERWELAFRTWRRGHGRLEVININVHVAWKGKKWRLKFSSIYDRSQLGFQVFRNNRFCLGFNPGFGLLYVLHVLPCQHRFPVTSQKPDCSCMVNSKLPQDVNAYMTVWWIVMQWLPAEGVVLSSAQYFYSRHLIHYIIAQDNGVNKYEWINECFRYLPPSQPPSYQHTHCYIECLVINFSKCFLNSFWGFFTVYFQMPINWLILPEPQFDITANYT